MSMRLSTTATNLPTRKRQRNFGGPAVIRTSRLRRPRQIN